MSTQQATTEQATVRTWSVPWVLLSYLAIGLVALLPRVLDLGTWISGDEASFWIRRSETFLRAIQTGDWAATAITTHPGVTTMWLGSAGLLLRDALADRGMLADQSFTTFMAVFRMPAALVHTGAVLLGYWMLRRMFAPLVAALAALLWAADPFVVAFSRVLHTDALPATFLTLSMLAACLFWHHERRLGWLALSGACAGLAILSKSPAIIIGPAVGAIALWTMLQPTTDDRRPTTDSGLVDPAASGRWSVVWPFLLWGAVAALTVFALWPVLWVSPQRALDQIVLGVDAEGAEPHMLGNFFLGRQDDAPGLLFYPVALALRLTPWAMLGLFLLPMTLRRPTTHDRPPTTGSGRPEHRQGSWWSKGGGRWSPQARDLAALALFAILFLVAMSLFPKKFNRYLVPMFPAVNILAAYGLGMLATLGRGAGESTSLVWRLPRWLGRGLLIAVALLALLNVAWYHPYGIAYYNQAIGGAKVGAETFVTGWGEGLDQVARWLNQQPDITGVLTVSTMTTPLQPYMRRGAQSVRVDGPLPAGAGYVVVYVRNVQWGTLGPPFDQFYLKRTPLHVVTIHGVDYAWIYQAPWVAEERPAAFGPDIRLLGYTAGDPPVAGAAMTMRLTWEVGAAPQADYMLFAHLIAPDGRRVAEANLPYSTSAWRPGRYETTELALPLPADLQPGTYRLTIGLFDLASGARLPLSTPDPIDPALDGTDALPLTTVDVSR